tara:strand:- start:17878 stop:18792 length:915 start_codon:yes stop_codon:yes gene_type:complete
MATSLDLSRTYTSYSGVDIRVIINGAQAGSMQALSYAIQREKAPIYVMGSVDPVSYSRGKRGIAGTMISLMMDVHMLYTPSFTGERALLDADEIFPSYEGGTPASTSGAAGVINNILGTSFGASSGGNAGALNNANNETSTVQLNQVGGGTFGRTLRNLPGTGAPNGPSFSGGATQRFNPTREYELDNLGNNYKVAKVFYVDQILPFDVTIVAANEYGQSAQMRLYGCEILNEGSGFSIDDIVIENQMTYVCRTILPWRSFELQDSEKASMRDKLYNGEKTDKVRAAQPGKAAADGVSRFSYND